MMETICPKCLEVANIKVDIGDGDTLTCTACEEEFSLADVRNLVESWGKLLPWLDSHPSRQNAAK